MTDPGAFVSVLFGGWFVLLVATLTTGIGTPRQVGHTIRRGRDVPPPVRRPLAELRTSGLLWLINRIVFHPRGLALALHYDKDETVTGWSLLRATNGEPFAFEPDADDRGFKAAEQTIADARDGR